MLLGMNLLLWTRDVLPQHYELFDTLAATGYDGVELPVMAGSDAQYRDIGRALDGLGLRRTGLTVLPAGASCISDDAPVRQAALDHIRWAVDRLAEAGGEVLCGPYHQPLFQIHGRPPTPLEIERVVDIHTLAADHAAACGIRLAMEPLNRFECYVCTTAGEAAAIVAQVGRANYGFLYDTFHANIEEKDPLAALHAAWAKGHVNHVHISENDRGTPGRGHAKIRETIAALKALGYDGWLTIEAFGKALPELAAATRVWRDFFASPEEVYTEGYRYIRECWG